MQENSGADADVGDIAPTIAAFAATGQDSEAVRVLFDWLLADLQPQNLIEKLWVRDIAALTIRCGELRMVQATVHKLLMEQALAADAARGAAPAETSRAAQAEGIAAVLARAHDGLLERLVGLTYTQHLALFDGMTRLEAAVRAERDRVIAQFDRRRSETVGAMIDAMMDAC